VFKEYNLATSFICEHSAEFALVPYMKTLLEKEFYCVAPMFPWLSREFGKMSKKVHDSDNFHILTLFPRRPKVGANSNIFITLNYELSQVKEIGEDKGITVLAGCPMATNFWELASCEDFAWIDVDHPDTHEYLVPVKKLSHGARLNDGDIIELVKNSPLHSMKSFEDFIRTVRDKLPSSFYGARYKPVYFLIKEH